VITFKVPRRVCRGLPTWDHFFLYSSFQLSTDTMPCCNVKTNLNASEKFWLEINSKIWKMNLAVTLICFQFTYSRLWRHPCPHGNNIIICKVKMFDYLLDWNIRFANGPTHLSTVTVSFNVLTMPFALAIRSYSNYSFQCSVLSPVHTATRRMRLSPKTATVAELGDSRRFGRVSPNSRQIVAVSGDYSLRIRRL